MVNEKAKVLYNLASLHTCALNGSVDGAEDEFTVTERDDHTFGRNELHPVHSAPVGDDAQCCRALEFSLTLSLSMATLKSISSVTLAYQTT